MMRLPKIVAPPASIRFFLYTAIGILVWNYRSDAIQDVLLVGAFIFALWRNPRGFTLWLRPAGLAFLGAGALILLRLPAAGVTAASAKELLKYVDVVLAVLALPALFPTRRKIENALFYTAWAVVAVLAFDLARLVASLKGQVFEIGHELEPFAFGHSNLSAMMGGAACLVLLTFAGMLWPRRGVALACLGGVWICLAHAVCIASRGPQVALAGTFWLAAFLLPPGWRRKAVLGLLMILAVVALVVNIEQINPRFADRAALCSFAGRDVVWSHLPSLIREHPVVGHGWGTAAFEAVYHGSAPPASPFYFHHSHNYWLQVAFATGLLGVTLHLVGWGILAVRLLIVLARSPNISQRLLPALVLLLMAYVHLYGLVDWPAGVVGIMLTALIPIALVVTDWPREG